MPAGTTAVDGELVKRRQAQSLETLRPETIQWLAGLPPDVRPRSLPIAFTRIANELGRRWNDEHKCLTYLEDLLIDRRGNRSGFPMGIALEIASLKNFFETALHPMPQTAWDEIADRRRGT